MQDNVLCLQVTSYQDIGQVTDNGLVKGHAYAITDTDQVSSTAD